jgi:hypothetical protein
MLKALLCIPILTLALSAQAELVSQFTGNFDVSRWTITQQGGVVDTSAAPGAVSITGADDDSGPSEQSMTITALEDGVVAFSWAYETQDSAPVWDAFGFLLNGTFIPVSDDLGDVTQAGSFSYSVRMNDVFGFSVVSFDSFGGAATAMVSGFTFTPADDPPAPVPTPSTLPLVLLALLGSGAALRLRRGQA